MFAIAVSDMPKMKKFCVEKLGFRIATEYKQDEGHWWTSMRLPDDSINLTFSTLIVKDEKPGINSFYLLAPDIETAYKELAANGGEPTPIEDDLYGTGSGVKWFSLVDPDGNTWTIAEAMAPWMI